MASLATGTPVKFSSMPNKDVGHHFGFNDGDGDPHDMKDFVDKTLSLGFQITKGPTVRELSRSGYMGRRGIEESESIELTHPDGHMLEAHTRTVRFPPEANMAPRLRYFGGTGMFVAANARTGLLMTNDAISASNKSGIDRNGNSEQSKALFNLDFYRGAVTVKGLEELRDAHKILADWHTSRANHRQVKNPTKQSHLQAATAHGIAYDYYLDQLS